MEMSCLEGTKTPGEVRVGGGEVGLGGREAGRFIGGRTGGNREGLVRDSGQRSANDTSTRAN